MRRSTFEQALEETALRRRNLLLGNGFSISASDRFSYRSLYEEAFPREEDAHVRGVFERLGTHDFEAVARALSVALDVVSGYPEVDRVVEAISADRDQLGQRLIRVLTATHPNLPSELTEQEYQRSGTFLGHFRRAGQQPMAGAIYTTNYDLLLYWTLMRNHGDLQSRDGFGGAPLKWLAADQSVFYLHGALHFFADDDGEVTKLVYGRPLIDQIAAQLDGGRLPLFVSEGTTEQKVARINGNPYLRAALDGFEEVCRDRDSAMFVFGHSLSAVDRHIVQPIATGSLTTLYVATVDPAREGGRFAAMEAEWNEARREVGGDEIEIVIFNALDTHVWR
ncbi:DUF4917 family protein [Brevundimonas olei]|uniref:DUF4917 family protein n=1 Tax=Brevundimonas olei TaxID=657642 RepID=A0ABZ2IDZ3_9CAUL